MRWPLALLVLAACSSSSPASSSVSGQPTASTLIAPTPTATAPAPTPSNAVATSPVLTASPTTAPPDEPPVVPVGFERGAAVVTKADGTTCDICVWLATTSSARVRGLMGVTDLGAADAMAFVYPRAHTGSFWMRNTPLPLSIAFFAPDGTFIDAFDMEPCVTDTCTSYATPADFLVAVEVPQGELAALGMEPGSTLRLLDQTCPET